MDPQGSTRILIARVRKEDACGVLGVRLGPGAELCLAQQLLGPAQLYQLLVGQIAEGLMLLLHLCNLVDSFRGKTCF